ncbi:unnamed protein product [Linum trigynum]|uniref:Uncharacterized protein n=1 Tax=Linum trigynum TaxID=586398 RepID=A0AAV2FUV7_9ROSI
MESMLQEIEVTTRELSGRLDKTNTTLLMVLAHTVNLLEEQSNDDMARVEDNENRVTEEMEISVNKIDGKETMRNGDYHLCEAVTQRSASDGKETVRRGGHHLDEAIIYRSANDKEGFEVEAHHKEGVAVTGEGSCAGFLEQPTSTRRLLVRHVRDKSKTQTAIPDEVQPNFGEGGGFWRLPICVLLHMHTFFMGLNYNDDNYTTKLAPWSKSRHEGAILYPAHDPAVKSRVSAKERKKIRGRTGSWKFRRRSKPPRRKSCCCFRRQRPRLGIELNLGDQGSLSGRD